ncbi:trypsin-4-like [Ischnura elegans]|uniref:trypsin-4-like n=1 Tax=Ischnura elegans TaxID=197161 RepID=UPI001ED89926|nr:trypsin-4-like [Ischnura elegans]XP_046406916.1 trypsin-4-like [Ischnura elegans]XP_046406917.1 trypsin-4-like [Ischnura elegans]
MSPLFVVACLIAAAGVCPMSASPAAPAFSPPRRHVFYEGEDDYYDEVYDEDSSFEEDEDDSRSSAPYMGHSSGKCGCTCGLSTQKGRIVGGHRIKQYEFPWLAAMVRDGRLYCAASLITSEHLLTAAHCLRGFDKKDIKVVLGAHDRTAIRLSGAGDAVVRRIARVAMHPDFDPMTFDNDIAIITIDQPVEFSSKIRPVCLPIRDDGDYTGEKATVVGWGRTEEAKPTSDFPLKVEVVVMSKDECDSTGYGADRITKNMFCAGYTDGGRDSCQGDSGGPLHVFNKGGSTEIIGVVSWGRGCARKNFPGIYTKLTRYTDFIHRSIGTSCLCQPV